MSLTLEEIGEWVAVASQTAHSVDPIRLREAVQVLLEDDHWKIYVDPADRRKHEWQDFRGFCERGLSVSVEGLVHLLSPYPSLAGRVRNLATASRGRPAKGEEKSYIVTDFPKGNSRSEATARLLRERPDLAKQVDAGEISSHRAMIQAGFRRPTATVYIDTPEAAIQGLLRRFSHSELEKALEETP